MAKKKNRVPKRIAGVKIPKYMRKSSLIQAMLGSSLGRDILANAITAGAGAAAAVLLREREAVADVGEKGLRKGARAMALVGEAVQSAASAAVDTVGAAARSILPEGERAEGERARKKQHGKEAVSH
jgi:hypothetical protein